LGDNLGFPINGYEFYPQADNHITKKDDGADYKAKSSGTKKEVANGTGADEAGHHETESSD
jgi:hypothetical protein